MDEMEQTSTSPTHVLQWFWLELAAPEIGCICSCKDNCLLLDRIVELAAP
jgi:hypothetical protein